jgi:heme/copper-type cytochrome/quinol oxidase subunit 1
MRLVYFTPGAGVGFAMLLWPNEKDIYTEVHAHLNLLGFMSMMIYGVGYHILPKFSGTFIYSTRIMTFQFWVANIGLIGMAISWPMKFRGSAPSLSEPILILSAFLSLIAVALFAFNIFKTIKPVQTN